MPSANKTKSASSETAAKILLFDVETFPNVGLTWGIWDQRVIKVLRRKMICSISYQWYPDKKRTVIALPDFKGYDPKVYTNKLLIQEFAKVRAQADIEVAHNLIDFDDKETNREIFLNKIFPGPVSKKVDTLKILRARMNLNSNKLDDVCQELGIGEKLAHPGLAMWVGCMEGDEKSWHQMKRYNGHDVDPLLRGLYEHIRPWMPNHPAVRPREDGNQNPPCPLCNERRLQSRGTSMTRRGRIPRIQCAACGHWPPVAWIEKAWRIK